MGEKKEDRFQLAILMPHVQPIQESQVSEWCSGRPVTPVKTPPLLVLHLSHDTGESERPINWTQYIIKIMKKKDGTICAFPHDV
jgi:hypothetical protein